VDGTNVEACERSDGGQAGKKCQRRYEDEGRCLWCVRSISHTKFSLDSDAHNSKGGETRNFTIQLTGFMVCAPL
jgi:hypothetical protein